VWITGTLYGERADCSIIEIKNEPQRTI
jgi:hypothetical protein